jgi:rhodanese-related sulfurtransferase
MVLLLILGCFLAFMPQKRTDRFVVSPGRMALWAASDTTDISVDEVARLLVSETPDVSLIDVRNPEEFLLFSLPGSVNIPLQTLLKEGNKELLGRRKGKNIFYSNGDDLSTAALTIAAGSGYSNCYRMAGGLNQWFGVVMNATFSGERISAKENALYSNRLEAKRLFTQYNSLPDSLKHRLFATLKTERKKLDGGCE